MGSLFEIILFVIFIVLPVISNMMKSGQKKNKGKAARRQPTRQVDQGEVVQPRPTQPQTVQQVETRQADGAANSKADFERRLAEARARVQQSMSEPSSNRSQEVPRAQASQPQASQARPTARQVAPAQQARPQLRPQPQLQPQGRPQQKSLEVLNPLGGQTAKAKSIESKSLEGQSLERSFPARNSRQTLQSSRANPIARAGKANREVTSNSLLGSHSKKSAKRSGKDSDRPLAFDSKAIMGGLIWKQILDKPKSKKRISNYN